MAKFRVYLNQGSVLTVIADDFVVHWGNDGKVVKWSATGLKKGVTQPIYISPSAIVAVEES